MLDTGWIYGMGRTENVLGEWLGARGVREAAVVIGKGAHSPLTYPDVIRRQLAQTLDRLGTDYVDVYFMHRDNLDVPVVTGRQTKFASSGLRISRPRAQADPPPECPFCFRKGAEPDGGLCCP